MEEAFVEEAAVVRRKQSLRLGKKQIKTQVQFMLLLRIVRVVIALEFLFKVLCYNLHHTGCFIMIEIKFELHTQARIQAVSREKCTCLTLLP